MRNILFEVGNFKMAVLKGTNCTATFRLLTFYCYFLVVPNTSHLHRRASQCWCNISIGKRNCTLRGTCSDLEESEQDYWTTAELMCNQSVEPATVEKSNCRPSMQGKGSFLCERKHCDDVSIPLEDVGHTEMLTGISRLKMLVKESEKVMPGVICLACEQCVEVKLSPSGWNIVCLLDISLAYCRVSTTQEIPSFSGIYSDFTVKFFSHEKHILRNTTTHRLALRNPRIANSSVDNSYMPDGKDFPYFPERFRAFYNHVFSQHSNHLAYCHTISVAWWLIHDLYMLVMYLAILHKYRKEYTEKDNKNINSLALGHFNLCVKWHWSWEHWNQKSFDGKLCICYDDAQQFCSNNWNQKSFDGKLCICYDDAQQFCSNKENSSMDILKEFIFRPWLLKLGGVNSFLHNNDNFMTIHVNPVTRFLPDPTYNPDIDLSNVGYRLATLAALPPSVPVSRVRLADAGFYCRGHNEEVICYSCHVRHSDWSRGGDPMEIHRELSPHCEHVLARDRELAALASSINRGVHVNAVSHDNNESGHSESHRAPEVTHMEDGESAEARISGEHSRATSAPSGAAVSATNAANGVQVSASTSENRGAPHENSSQTSSHVGMNHLSTTSGGASSAASSDPRTTGPRNFSSVQSTETSSGVSTVEGGSAGRRTGHLFPQPRLDLGQAVYPMYQDMARRRRTFTSAWDETRAPPLEDILQSGMFYAGYADCVRCFFCGVGLKHWVVTDDVWTEHIRWRPACDYLRAIKGDDFIRAVQRRLGVSNSSGGAEPPPAARRPGPNQNSQNASSQPTTTTTTTTSSSSHSQAGLVPAAVPMTSSGSAEGTGTTSVTSTMMSVTSVVASSGRAPPASREEESMQGTSQSGSVSARAAMPSSSSGRVDPSEERRGGEGEGRRGVDSTDASDASAERERLARLQAENRQLASQFQCHMCHRARIDTILMPCGHLVICNTCASSVTSCPLCQSTVQATARVYLDH